MNIPPPLPAGGVLERQALLFTPGARLGWVFRDRRQSAVPFPEPPPDPEAFNGEAIARAEAAEASYQKARRWAGKPSLIVVLVLLLLAGCARAINGSVNTGATLLAAVILGGPGLVIWGVAWHRREQARTARPDKDYQQALETWQERATVHEQAESARLNEAAEWGSAEPPTRRLDIFGGSLWGWQALLTTHGASLLATQPLLCVDLTGELACVELTATAQAAGVQSAQYLLPADLGRCGLLARLSPAQLADAVTEAIHAGTPGGARADRAIDVRVLEQLTGALGDDVTLVRLAAAAGAALGHPTAAGPLTAQEEALISGELFPASYRQQIGPNLVRLDAFLTDLARYADGSTSAPGDPGADVAYYTCLALDSGPRGARVEMLTALIIQWLTVQVTSSTASAPAVIVAGADEITRPHLERLSAACERRGVPLTLLFRHLRDDGLEILGGGTAAFMRLGNHTEAEQAASFIGRQHKFELSQLTATLGGNETHTRTDSEGYGTSETRSVASSRGRHSGVGSEGSSGGLTRTGGSTVSRNWSTALSWAKGTNWSDATATQRVYEYTVEPTVLQSLPDHALLLVSRAAAGTELRPVECDPAIITLPRVSTRPLPSDEVPAQIVASAGNAAGGWWTLPGQHAQPDYQPSPELPPPSPDQWRQPRNRLRRPAPPEPPHGPGTR